MIELAGILVLGFLAQWLAWRIRIPAILPLILIGLAVGPFSTFITGGEKFIDGDRIFQDDLKFDAVSLAVGLILFEGGLTLKLKEIRNLGSALPKILLLDVLVTMIGGGLAAKYIMGFQTNSSLLFGALIIVTGPTVIGPILRNVRPNFNVNTVLKWEGILIDPIGALIAILTYEFIISGKPNAQLTLEAIKVFTLVVLIGLAIGAAFAYIVRYILSNNLIPKYLRNIVMLAMVIACFSISDTLHKESGLLAVTVMGMFMANFKNMQHLKDILTFNEEVVIILISFLFIMLSSRIDLADIELVISWQSFALFGVVIFVLRPICVFGGTINSHLTFNEKLFISWISPRGIVTAAVASIFSINLIDNPVPFIDMKDAFMLLPLTFLIILGTVILQGLSAKPLAKALGVTRKEPSGVIFLSADKAARYLAHYIQKKGIPVLMADTSKQNSREAEAMGLEVHNRSLISEDVFEEIDFSQYGQLYAMTPNTEINLLTCRFLSEELGKDRTYRIISKEETKHRSDAGTFTRNFLIGGRMQLQEINKVVAEKPEFIERSFEDKKELENFLTSKKDKVVPVFIYKEEKRIIPFTEHLPTDFRKGDKLVFFEPEK